jgi:hypothetical protein
LVGVPAEFVGGRDGVNGNPLAVSSLTGAMRVQAF